MLYIYHLEENNIPFYIGKTKNNPKKRERQHKYKLNNKFIKLVVIDNIDELNWKFWESWYIELYKSWGFDLLNKNDGGGGPSYHNEETKQKIRVANKNKQISEKHKKYLSLLFKGKNRNITWGDKISQSLQNHPVLDITRNKISQSKKGKPLKHGYKISQSKKGKPINLTVSQSHKQFLQRLHSKSIIQYDLNMNIIKEWNSTQEAATYLNIQKGHICNALNGRSKTCCGFIWRYK